MKKAFHNFLTSKITTLVLLLLALTLFGYIGSNQQATTIKELKNDLSEVTNQHETIIDDYEKLKTELNTLKEQTKKQEEKESSLTKELKDSKEELKKLKEDNEKLKADLVAKKTEEKRVAAASTAAATRAQSTPKTRSNNSNNINNQSTQQVVSHTEPAQVNTVYITNTGEKYHNSGCRSLKKSSIPISYNDAIARGYEPCKLCH